MAYGQTTEGIFRVDLARGQRQCNPVSMKQRPMTIDVYAAIDVIASDGVMKGEPISIADELVLDDVFGIRASSPLHALNVTSGPDGLHRTDDAQNFIHLNCCLTLMAPDGGTHEALVLVEVQDDTIAEIYLLPLGELLPLVDYDWSAWPAIPPPNALPKLQAGLLREGHASPWLTVLCAISKTSRLAIWC